MGVFLSVISPKLPCLIHRGTTFFPDAMSQVCPATWLYYVPVKGLFFAKHWGGQGEVEAERRER